MKVPLRYQTSEYDCGPTAVLNALSFLYDTEEIPPDFVKKVYDVSLDDYIGGQAFHGGTSSHSMRYLSEWFSRYARFKNYPMRTEFYEGSEIHLGEDSPILNCLRAGGAVVAKCISETEHYVTLTGIGEDCVYVFDPYYEDEPELPVGVTVVEGRPKEMNRRVEIAVMDCNAKCDYAFCCWEHRCAMLIYRTREEKFSI